MAGTRTRVVVLGAGFGGLEVSTRLVAQLGDAVSVTLIDRSDAFVFGFAKLDVMFGRRPMAQVRHPYAALAGSAVDFRQETVTAIDPEKRVVVTDAGRYAADILVVALGADLDPAATPGLTESGHEFYSTQGAAALTDRLQSFGGGDVVIGVLGGFFKCPPAPYETAFMLHDHLVRLGVREASTIHVVTPMPKPIPISAEVSTAIVDLLDERDIRHSHATWVDGLDGAANAVRLRDGGSLPFDLFLGVPVHVAPPVVVDSGLTDDGWIAVDAATLATRFPGVFAVGDVASAPVPRAGVIAEGEARTVADVITHQIRGGEPPAPFAGEISCYIEMGDDRVGMANVNFLSGPVPVASYLPPSAEGAQSKKRFAAERMRRWFGA